VRTKNLIIYFLLAVAVSLIFGVFMLVRPQEKLKVRAETAAEDIKAIQQDLAQDGIPTTGLTVMTAPHFLGRDKDGKSWDVMAEKAVQQGTEAGLLRLYNLSAAVQNSRGQEVRIVAGDGTYNQSKDELSLTQGVKVSGQRFDLVIDAFTYNLGSGNGAGEGAVKLTSDLGTLRANHVSLQNNADRVVLKGKVHAVIKRGQK
jgi:hypothetical protein